MKKKDYIYNKSKRIFKETRSGIDDNNEQYSIIHGVFEPTKWGTLQNHNGMLHANLGKLPPFPFQTNCHSHPAR